MNRNKYKLHAAFFDATMLSEIEKPIEFELSIGNYGNKLEENLLPSSSTTPECNPVFDGCAYYFLPWGDIKPCMQITSYWEDISYRLEAINHIKKIREVTGRFYVERLSSIVVINRGFFFGMIWSFVSKFLDERIKRKITVLDNTNKSLFIKIAGENLDKFG